MDNIRVLFTTFVWLGAVAYWPAYTTRFFENISMTINEFLSYTNMLTTKALRRKGLSDSNLYVRQSVNVMPITTRFKDVTMPVCPNN